MKQICKSCGRTIRNQNQIGRQSMGSFFCTECTDKYGQLKKKNDIIETIKKRMILQMSLTNKEAYEIAKQNVNSFPFWLQKENKMKHANQMIITDVGSTTTKAVYLEKVEGLWKFIDFTTVPTTVEKPFEDVTIGVKNVILKLEKKTNQKLLEYKDGKKLEFCKDVMYLTTSSAGGGLQVLVVGLTMFDSAATGNRTAFGAGGVILDTFAIDDKRSALEQMQAMKVLHPDIILMSGGVDGGAVSPILRLGEILSLAKPKSKFSEHKIPLVFAGNKDMDELIKGLFRDTFELHIVPNIRPTMQAENMKPARDKIHELFLENVMEQAPGYANLKSFVHDDILPTPMGVINSLRLISEEQSAKTIAVDIGGATTDVFSYLNGDYFRTVSANYGMSYSISQVVADAGIKNVMQWLPADSDEEVIRDYIGNKMLFPQQNPQNEFEQAIEHAVAKEAIRMAKDQHLEMNFNRENVGFLDRLKQMATRDKFSETLFYEKEKEKKIFHYEDIEIVIGAGGVLSHCTKKQAMNILMDGLQTQGVTQLWRDKHFVSPHFGKLSAINETVAKELLMKECIEKLAVHIRPTHYNEKTTLNIRKNGKELRRVFAGEFLFIENKTQNEITLECAKGSIVSQQTELIFTTDLPLIVDLRLNPSFEQIQDEMNVYSLFDVNEIKIQPEQLEAQSKIENLRRELPYPGSVYVEKGNEVSADTVVAENLYYPPRIFVINLYDKTYLNISNENIRELVKIKEGDIVEMGQVIAETKKGGFLSPGYICFESPVRGHVVDLNFESGVILMREIQDYSMKPVTINIAKALGINPKALRAYMKKRVGDFVYKSEILAMKASTERRKKEQENDMDEINKHIENLTDKSKPIIVKVPSTGTIKSIDEKGNVLIQYDKEPFVLHAGVQGIVKGTDHEEIIDITVDGFAYYGQIGFGKDAFGKMKKCETIEDLRRLNRGDIVYLNGQLSEAFYQEAVRVQIGGIVTASVTNQTITKIIDKEIGVALTGNEKIPFPIIVMKGFGDFMLDSHIHHELEQHSGKAVFISGRTQIRAGVIRPMIVLSESH